VPYRRFVKRNSRKKCLVGKKRKRAILVERPALDSHTQINDPEPKNGTPKAGRNGKPVNSNTVNGEKAEPLAADGVDPQLSGKISRFVKQDRALVDRCLAGDPVAWSQMYGRFQGTLLASIRAFLGKATRDFHLIDEVSARVWYALVRDDFELLAKFDPARNCRFSTFLSVVAKSETRQLLRSERRRKVRELVASRPELDASDKSVLSDDEFIATLSSAERVFYSEVLLSTAGTAREAQYSQNNLWQLRHRVRRKLEQFLD